MEDEVKLFIWDFHGVLEKGNDAAVLEITNLALKQHGYARRMTQNENVFLSEQQWCEYFAFLLPEHEPEEYVKLQTTCFEISHNQPDIISRNIQLNDHADFVLETIHHTEHQQILISNTLPISLEMFVKMVGIEKYFPNTHRFGVDTHQQKWLTKGHCLAEFLKDQDAFERMISIGDSPGDMALIEQEGQLKGVSYLYAHPTRLHRLTKCDYKIRDLRLVLQEIHEVAPLVVISR